MKKINFSINYITNFKPSKNFGNDFTFLKNKNNIILCKHFVIFLYLMKIILKKNTNLKIFFKPTTRKLDTLLRPPYRHKISRHQITLSRYKIVVSFVTLLDSKFVVKNMNSVIFFIKEISNTLNFFETNICYTHSIKVNFSCFFNSWFVLMNYKSL